MQAKSNYFCFFFFSFFLTKRKDILPCFVLDTWQGAPSIWIIKGNSMVMSFSVCPHRQLLMSPANSTLLNPMCIYNVLLTYKQTIMSWSKNSPWNATAHRPTTQTFSPLRSLTTSYPRCLASTTLQQINVNSWLRDTYVDSWQQR